MCPVQAPPRSIINLVGLPLMNHFLSAARSALVYSESEPTSWWRSRSKNAGVEGKPRSQHLLGLAFDSVPISLTPTEAAHRQRQLGFVAVVEADHVHAQAFRRDSIPKWVFDRIP